MSLSIESRRKLPSISSLLSRSKSGSILSSSGITANLQNIRLFDKRLWRAIDFLHIVIMIFSLYTAVIVAILRNELVEQ
jgi:hypothetical protein